MYNHYFRFDAMKQNIVAYARGDVNGDTIPDNVYLTGIRTPDSHFIKNITLVIQDGISGMITNIPLSENAGYDPSLFLGDFTGDRIDDILVSIYSGGSGAIMYHYVYSFVNNVKRLLFNFNLYNEQYKYDVNYKNNYKAEVISKENNMKYIINLLYKGMNYLNEIYNKNGVLKNPIIGFVNPLSGLYPIDFDSDRIYELLAYQRIAGRYNADALGYVLNTLKWNNNMFNLFNQNVAIFGAEI